jgi:hypothetical protein
LPSFIAWSNPASSCSIGAEASEAFARPAKADASKTAENASRKIPLPLLYRIDIELSRPDFPASRK